MYCTVVIILKHSTEFEFIKPVISGFHVAKAAIHSLGKYQQDCGFEDALTELGGFGQKVVEAVFGTIHNVVHYVNW